MKRNFLLKSGFCMLVAIGVLTPLTTVANEQSKMTSWTHTYVYGETPTEYGNPGEDALRRERGAMGPIASSKMDDTATSRYIYGETPTQYGASIWGEPEKMVHGAQGPIRNDMDDTGFHNFAGEQPTEYGK